MAGRGSFVERIRRVPPFALDVALALALLIVGVLDLHLLHPSDVPPHWHIGWSAYALFAVVTLAVAIRRKKLPAGYALWVTAVVIGTLTRSMFALVTSGVLVEAILVFSVAQLWSAPAAVAVLIIEFALDTTVVSAWVDGFDLWLQIMYGATLLGLVWFAGRAAHRRKRLIGDLHAQTAQLRREQDQLTRLAVATERRRIAGELHSMVLEGVERMSTQTASARVELTLDSARAAEAIQRIETTGREALVAMGRLLALVDAAEDAPFGPPEPARQGAKA
jgi:signal transduction histidine kinase